MKPSEFREGIAQAVNDSATVWVARFQAGTWLGDCHTYQADAVIAYLKTLPPMLLADWLKEAKP